MAITNTYRFSVALAIYLAVGWAVGQNLGPVARWPYEVALALTFAFLLAYGALAFVVLRGTVLLRLILVALLAPLSHVGQLVLFGVPLQIGLVAQEAVSLIGGAALVSLAQLVIQRNVGKQRNEA